MSGFEMLNNVAFLRKLDSLGCCHLLCSILLLVPLWWCDFPPGIDLPQHANLLSIIASFLSGDSEYRFFYGSNIFTPYVTTYLVGGLITGIANAVIAIKVILSITVVGTALSVDYWLSTCKLDRRLALFAYPLVFGFPFQWGFLSFCFSIPLIFLVLGLAHSWSSPLSVKRTLIMSLLLILLFITHLCSFIFAIACIGFICLLSPCRFGLCLTTVPSLTLFLIWKLATSRSLTMVHSWDEFPVLNRIGLLLGGYFSVEPSSLAVWAGLILTVGILIAVRGSPAIRLCSSVPFFVASLLFFVLPDTVSGTSFIASRYVGLVHLLLLGLVVAPPSKRYLWRICISAVFLIVVFDVRLLGFNSEIAGLKGLAGQMPTMATVSGQPLLKTPDSAWLGTGQLRHVGAWLTSLSGGVYENDFARYFQLPIQRHADLPWVRTTSATVFRGSLPKDVASTVQPNGAVKYKRESGNWHLVIYGAPTPISGLSVVRWGQEWGVLKSNRSVQDKVLSVGGVAYPKGIGSHINGWVQLYAEESDCTVKVGCGIDDASGGVSHVRCSVEKEDGAVAWASPVQSSGELPTFTSVTVPAGKSVFLVGRHVARHGIDHGHLNWLLSECQEGVLREEGGS